MPPNLSRTKNTLPFPKPLLKTKHEKRGTVHGMLVAPVPDTAKTEIQTTFAAERVMMADVHALCAKLLDKAGKLVASKISARTFQVSYKGLDIELSAPTLAAEIDLRIATAIKSSANSRDLEQLHFEESVFGSAHFLKKNGVLKNSWSLEHGCTLSKILLLRNQGSEP